MGLILKQTPIGEKYFDVIMHSGKVLSDLPFLQAFNKTLKSANHHLDLSLYPEPFAGNPKAKVYLLSGNPGWSASDNLLMMTNQLVWDSMMQHSYNPIPSIIHSPTMYWLDTDWKSNIKKVIDIKGNLYDGGFIWWERITSHLRNEENIQDLHLKLFNIDYHPYHSQNVKIDSIINSLPSKACVDEIIKDAFNDKDRIFVILRCKTEWEKRLTSILGVSKLPSNVIYLNSPQNVCLTPGNMDPADWSRFVAALK